MINPVGDFRKNIYIGGGLIGKRRFNNLDRLVQKYFKGNWAAFFNDAINRIYNLDPETGESLPREPKKP